MTIDNQHTQTSKLLSIVSFPLLRYSKAITLVCLGLLVLSTAMFLLAFFNSTASQSAIKVPLSLLLATLVMAQGYFFIEYRLKRPLLLLPLADALKDPEKYNLAEWFSLPVCFIMRQAAAISRKRGLVQITSKLLLYSVIKYDREFKQLLFRLGLDVKSIQESLKNSLEKQQGKVSNSGMSALALDCLLVAAKAACERGSATIESSDLFFGLASADPFFKKLLIAGDVILQDVSSVITWAEKLREQREDRRRFFDEKHLLRIAALGEGWASGFTPTLDRFCIDWTRLAKQYLIGEVVGHQQEISQVELALAKSHFCNALLVGPAGAGKKSIVQAFAQRCFLGQSLPELNGARVVELDMTLLLATIQDQEKLELTLDQIFQEVVRSGNVVLVIDELNRFISPSGTKLVSVDISGILAKYLAMPACRCIGMVSLEALHQNVESDAAIMSYVTVVQVMPVGEDETMAILQAMAVLLEQQKRVHITYPALRQAVLLTGRYLPSAPFPQKAIDALEEAVASLHRSKETVLLPQHIAGVVSRRSQIPVGKMERSEKETLINLEDLIHQKIINQHEAVSQIASAMRRSRTALGLGKRPMGVLLFLGPTGVGKTETAKALCEIYFGSWNRDEFMASGSSRQHYEKMIRLDMSEFQSVSDIHRLIGSINPVPEEGLLTTPVRERPFSLVLLDEIEKAHPDILHLFLQVFDEGYITDGRGRKVMFTDTIIICTSNAGANLVFKGLQNGHIPSKDELLDHLFEKGIFVPEFINRFDAAVVFHPLSKENLLDIAKLMLSNLTHILDEKGIHLIASEALYQRLIALSYKPEFGARKMRRVVQDTVEASIAKALLTDQITKGDTIEIDPENFNIIKIP